MYTQVLTLLDISVDHNLEVFPVQFSSSVWKGLPFQADELEKDRKLHRIFAASA